MPWRLSELAALADRIPDEDIQSIAGRIEGRIDEYVALRRQWLEQRQTLDPRAFMVI